MEGHDVIAGDAPGVALTTARAEAVATGDGEAATTGDGDTMEPVLVNAATKPAPVTDGSLVNTTYMDRPVAVYVVVDGREPNSVASTGDDAEVPSYKITRSQQDSVPKVENVSVARVFNAAVSAHAQFKFALYVPMRSAPEPASCTVPEQVLANGDGLAITTEENAAMKPPPVTYWSERKDSVSVWPVACTGDGTVEPRNVPRTADDVEAPSYSVTASQHASVSNVEKDTRATAPALAVNTYVHTMRSVYDDPVMATVPDPTKLVAEGHGPGIRVLAAAGDGVAATLGVGTSEGATEENDAENPLLTTDKSVENVTSIAVPEENMGAGSAWPRNVPRTRAVVVAPSYTVTVSQHASVSNAENESRTTKPGFAVRENEHDIKFAYCVAFTAMRPEPTKDV